jgi:hypothetical protein
VPKPNGDKRFILNLKCLNKFVDTKHFKMEDYRTAAKFITKNCYMACIDLRDAYFLLPVHESHRKYLRFMYDNTLYEFNSLAFGLSSSPYVFTKLMKPVMEYLRSQGLLSVIYLDDIFLIGTSYSDCKTNVNITKDTLERLGFLLNFDKSCLTPKKECKFLGFVFDSQNMIMTLPDTKRIKIKEKVQAVLNTRRWNCTLRDFARFLGLLVSACPAIQYSWLYTKEFERFKFLCLLNNPSYEQTVRIPTTLKKDMLWWLNNIDQGYTPLCAEEYKLEIFSDASTTGWGAYCDHNKSYGHWKDDEINLHINELEIKAAFFALKSFARNLNDCRILLRIDNVTAISFINRMGSIQFRHLNKIAREIWEWCECRKIFVFASYIKSKENFEADSLSRKKFNDIEWELNDYAFNEITSNYGYPEVDLFASRHNAKCPIYVTWKNDPDAWAIDAFTIPWKNKYFYAFPPFALLAKTMQKIITDKAECIVVVPYWPMQPWFPLFKKLTVSKCITFEPNAKLLISPFRTTHNLHKTLKLVAAKLSGKHY